MPAAHSLSAGWSPAGSWLCTRQAVLPRARPDFGEANAAVTLCRAGLIGYPDYRGNGVGPVRIDGAPFDLTLMRFEPPIVRGRHFEIRHMVENLDELRIARMKAAIEKKFPKLAAWKVNEGAKSVLVLEQNDMQLTNPGIVADTFIPLAKARDDRPDETYLVVTFPTGDWWLWPILIGDRTYDDYVRSDEKNYWEYDPAKLKQLTKR